MWQFEHSNYLFGLILLIPLFYFLFQNNLKQDAILSNFKQSKMFSSYFRNYSLKRLNVRIALSTAALLFMMIGLANFQYGYHEEKLMKASNDIYIALDISSSMLCEDTAPSRMDRAKKFTIDLINELKGNNIGIILFAGGAYLQLPLTSDYAAAIMMVNIATPDLAGTQGTNVNEVASLVSRANEKQKSPASHLIIITDGEDNNEEDLSALSDLKNDGTKTYSIAVGTEEGGTIPIGQDVKMDPETMKPVVTKMSIKFINEIAKTGGGKAYDIEDAKSISDLSSELDQNAKKSTKEKVINTYRSFFQAFALLALLFLLIELLINKGILSENILKRKSLPNQ
jgi:Ca-activated chloride channel homolog